MDSAHPMRFVTGRYVLMVRKATIAEVKAKQVCIWLFWNAPYTFAVAVTMLRFLSLREDDIDPGFDPTPERGSRHTGAAGSFRLRQPARQEPGDQPHFIGRPGHAPIVVERMFERQGKRVEPRGRFPSSGPRAGFQVAPLGLRCSL